MNLRERFDAKYEPVTESGCWLWTATRTPRGYGMIGRGRRGGSPAYAHRVAYEIHVGPIPDGMVVMHKCDTPSCVNPAHLSLGTQAENINDCLNKGRHRNQNSAATHCKNGHELAGKNLIVDVTGFRRCRACRNEYLKNWKRSNT